jgi:hypothetical protein
MPDDTAGTEHQSPATPESRREPTIWDPEVERLEEAECWGLISAGGGVGRLAYSGRSGPAVLPAGYQVDEGSLLFRIALGSPTDQDLRTGIEGAEYKAAVEIDDVGTDAPDGWFDFIQGVAHHLDSGHDHASAGPPGEQPSAGTQDNFVRITPTFIAGRRLRRH